VGRLKRGALIALFVLFTLLGVVLLLIGDAEQRVGGLVVVLFFGVTGVAWYVTTRPSRRPATGFQVASVAQAGGLQPAFVVRQVTARMVAGGAGALGIGVSCGLIAAGAMGQQPVATAVLLGACAVFLCVLGVIILLRARRGGGRLALTRAGVSWIGPIGSAELDWDSIADVGTVTVHETEFLAVSASHPSRIEVGGPQRAIQDLERSMVGSDLNIPLPGIDIDQGELFAAFGRYRAEPEARGRIGTPSELASLKQLAAPPPSSAILEDLRPRKPTLAAWTSLVYGGLLGLLALSGFLGTGSSDNPGARLLGSALIAAIAAALVVAGIVLLRGRRAGRWIAYGAGVALVGLAAYSSLRNPDGVPVGITIIGVTLVVLVLVAWGTRRGAWTAADAGVPSQAGR
jgi:hypothetical protein